LTIVLTGGGSGGHVTPVLAVAAELKRLDPNVKVVYVGQIGDRFVDGPTQDPNIDQVYTVRAGKFRRFHGEGMKQVLNVPVALKNIRDFFFVIAGIYQSWQLMKQIKPNVIFSRGGYVSVPVALGGHLNKVPYITHDSDPVPSLANRLIAKWAALHAVALPKELYPYPQDKTVTTGIPISKKFIPVDDTVKGRYRKEIDIPHDARLLFIIGGGLGSQNVNTAVIETVPHLLREFKDLYVVHVAGATNESEVVAGYKEELTDEEQRRVEVLGYTNDVYKYSGASDIIITRAGATNLAEFSIQGKACIVVPSAFLTGGHQLKSARFLEEKQAALILSDADITADSNRLAKMVSDLLRNPHLQEKLAEEISQFGKPDATNEIAKIILELGNEKTV
jgi:UDP-N-acetylglucosamine--N-acetylmuramyl-(pentapeptide) pyrophosphoryl-undecaprenol N-acetylglucosamine transferase